MSHGIQTSQILDSHIQLLTRLYQDIGEEPLHGIRQAVEGDLDGIVAEFYDEMLREPGSDAFLSHDLVRQRLRYTLAQWVRELFTPREPDAVPAFVQRQLEVGRVHARINVPMHMVNLGGRFLKRDILTRVHREHDGDLDRLIAVCELIDASIALINESYLGDQMVAERQSQALKMHAVSQNLAIECERLRSDLLDWLRRFMTRLYQQDQPALTPADSVRQSDFALWLHHKADLLFQQEQEIAKLKQQLAAIEHASERAIEVRKQGLTQGFFEQVEALNQGVTRANWLLAELVSHTLEMDGGRDPLTRLFNRRFLHTILQRETQVCIRHGGRFALLLVDLDHFKQLNDRHGHDAGDRVLCQVAEALSSQIRAGDFVFRYGGEEFLVVLSDISPENAQAVADKIRRGVRELVINAGDATIRVTASIGLALHDGHPDYSRAIGNADRALYAAKAAGRDRVVLADDLKADTADA
ncbi:diguanylate cyclase [Alkalispirillum mobile]|uniref:Diguanylate cyclase DosC n=1 Tax=Alkalispirillum mobile TaxID=85925 RepID=A0A498C147_9GAMM|nr:GGDEF domain-containing protein [Alkalispirillum mobile]RLK46820.1 diguanylate cyclase [Alkalispirillum mobile]